MDKKVIELLKTLKRAYISEMAGFNETFNILESLDTETLDKTLKENNINPLDIVLECIDVSEALKDLPRLTIPAIKDAFLFYGIDLTTDDVGYVLRKYLSK